MKMILDSLGVIATHWMLLLGILLVVICGQSLLNYLLRRIFGARFSAAEYYALSLAGWMLPAALISLLWYFFGAAQLAPQAWIFLLVLVTAIAALARISQTRNMEPAPSIGPLLLFLCAALFIMLRLVFVSTAVLPMYFDSAQHTLWTRELLTRVEAPSAATSLNWPLANYYHLGFHFLTAFITYITRAQISDMMLVLGQVILALMPFPFFLIVRHATQSRSAAIFSLALAAFGWYMPAHAVDWGKYPALASIALIPFVLSIAYLSIQNRNVLSGRNNWSLKIILVSGMLISVFLHSRSLIVFGMIGLAWVITSAWHKLPKLARFLFLGIAIAALISTIAFIQMKGILGPLFDPYGNKGYLVTLTVLLLSIFAYGSYPRLVFVCLLSTLLLLAGLFIPVTDLIPGYPNMTLLDRPFVEMILYIPLTLTGGFGLAALEQTLQNRNVQFLPGKYIAALLVILVVVNGLLSYDLRPSDCCDLAGTDDLTAIDWMDRNLPMDARILTSSTELKVLPTDEYEGSAGSDAGAWITPLIGRTTITMPFDTDFSQQQTLDTLCELRLDYVYVGGSGWPFNDSGMPVQPAGYRIVLALPGARLYEVTGCD